VTINHLLKIVEKLADDELGLKRDRFQIPLFGEYFIVLIGGNFKGQPVKQS
jgi:hypothetical protein